MGAVWTKVAVDKAVDGQVFSATTTPIGLPRHGAVGRRRLALAESGPRRTVEDGAATQRHSGFEGFGPYAAAANDALVVAVGLTSAGMGDESPDGLPGAAWFRTLALTAIEGEATAQHVAPGSGSPSGQQHTGPGASDPIVQWSRKC
jgi:hypothetical protein